MTDLRKKICVSIIVLCVSVCSALRADSSFTADALYSPQYAVAQIHSSCLAFMAIPYPASFAQVGLTSFSIDKISFFVLSVMVLQSPPEISHAESSVVVPRVRKSDGCLEIVNELRIPNSKSGREMMYDLRVEIVPVAGMESELEDLIEKHKLRIQDRIYTIIAQAEPDLFREPGRSTIKKQIKAMLEEYLGKGNVHSVLIPMLVGFRPE